MTTSQNAAEGAVWVRPPTPGLSIARCPELSEPEAELPHACARYGISDFESKAPVNMSNGVRLLDQVTPLPGISDALANSH
jgi:hypothetical protein